MNGHLPAGRPHFRHRGRGCVHQSRAGRLDILLPTRGAAPSDAGKSRPAAGRWAKEWRDELDRNRELVAKHVGRMDTIPRKLPLAGFGAGQFRARGRVHGATSRIRNPKERLARLTENAVARPADPPAFTASIATADQEPANELGPGHDGNPPRTGTTMCITCMWSAIPAVTRSSRP